MKERPILFNGEMVRALLRDVDPKTQTRRVAKSPRWSMATDIYGGKMFCECPQTGDSIEIPPPYRVGDRLWVRETWAEFHEVDQFDDLCSGYYYRATEKEDDGIKWRPSIHMPRAASRITLEVTGVRAERLQDISEEDAKAEGVQKEVEVGEYIGEVDFSTYRESFENLWNSLAKPGAKWSDNPWVWVIKFGRVENA